MTFIYLPKDVVDLTGLEHATNLHTICIEYGEKTPDFSKWKTTETKELEIDIPNSITTVDLKFLKEIKNLQRIRITGNNNPNNVTINYAELEGIPSVYLNGNTVPKKIEELKTLETLSLDSDNFKSSNEINKLVINCNCSIEIFKKYIIEPDDMECIEDSLIGKREVTLITCTVGGQQRLILKAKQTDSIRNESM